MSARNIRLALQTYASGSRILLQAQRVREASAPVCRSSCLPTRAKGADRGRAFSSSGSTPGDDEAAPATEAAGDGKVGDDFPWRTAPAQFVPPAGSASLVDLIVKGVSFEICQRGVDFKAGAEAAFVTTAAACFKMRQSEVLAPKPTERATAAAVAAAATRDEAPPKDGFKEDPAASAAAKGEEEAPLETSEEEAERVLAAIDGKLVAFLSDKGETGVPYYRLHSVDATAITRENFVLGAHREDNLSGRYSVSMSPSVDIVVEKKKNIFTRVVDAVGRNLTITCQVDVDLDCDETFYVKDKESGEIIQGKAERSKRRHRIRLENHFVMTDNNSSWQLHTWKVIDLDNWLKGNAFW